MGWRECGPAGTSALWTISASLLPRGEWTAKNPKKKIAAHPLEEELEFCFVGTS